jgi:hypothetical protein
MTGKWRAPLFAEVGIVIFRKGHLSRAKWMTSEHGYRTCYAVTGRVPEIKARAFIIAGWVHQSRTFGPLELDPILRV